MGGGEGKGTSLGGVTVLIDSLWAKERAVSWPGRAGRCQRRPRCLKPPEGRKPVA